MKIGCLQFAPQVGEINSNLDKADAILSKAGDLDSLDLLVLPELAFTGYNFQSLAEISPCLEPTTNGVSSMWARTMALKHSCHVVVGYPEKVDVANRWPTSPEFYNSAVLAGPGGDIAGNYRKTFLYATDETWALEGQGFFSGEVGNLGNVAIGICMDINPYRFETPWSKFEFAFHVIEAQANLVIVTMAWLTRDDAETFGHDLHEPHMETIEYWIDRFEPVIRQDREDEIIFVFCNRTGVEGDSIYAGSSTVIGIEKGQVKLYGLLGRGSNGLLVVDTNKPIGKFVRGTSAESEVGSKTGVNGKPATKEKPAVATPSVATQFVAKNNDNKPEPSTTRLNVDTKRVPDTMDQRRWSREVHYPESIGPVDAMSPASTRFDFGMASVKRSSPITAAAARSLSRSLSRSISRRRSPPHELQSPAPTDVNSDVAEAGSVRGRRRSQAWAKAPPSPLALKVTKQNDKHEYFGAFRDATGSPVPGEDDAEQGKDNITTNGANMETKKMGPLDDPVTPSAPSPTPLSMRPKIDSPEESDSLFSPFLKVWQSPAHRPIPIFEPPASAPAKGGTFLHGRSDSAGSWNSLDGNRSEASEPQAAPLQIFPDRGRSAAIGTTKGLKTIHSETDMAGLLTEKNLKGKKSEENIQDIMDELRRLVYPKPSDAQPPPRLDSIPVRPPSTKSRNASRTRESGQSESRDHSGGRNPSLTRMSPSPMPNAQALGQQARNTSSRRAQSHWSDAGIGTSIGMAGSLNQTISSTQTSMFPTDGKLTNIPTRRELASAAGPRYTRPVSRGRQPISKDNPTNASNLFNVPNVSNVSNSVNGLAISGIPSLGRPTLHSRTGSEEVRGSAHIRNSDITPSGRFSQQSDRPQSAARASTTSAASPFFNRKPAQASAASVPMNGAFSPPSTSRIFGGPPPPSRQVTSPPTITEVSPTKEHTDNDLVATISLICPSCSVHGHHRSSASGSRSKSRSLSGSGSGARPSAEYAVVSSASAAESADRPASQSRSHHQRHSSSSGVGHHTTPQPRLGQDPGLQELQRLQQHQKEKLKREEEERQVRVQKEQERLQQELQRQKQEQLRRQEEQEKLQRQQERENQQRQLNKEQHLQEPDQSQNLQHLQQFHQSNPRELRQPPWMLPTPPMKSQAVVAKPAKPTQVPPQPDVPSSSSPSAMAVDTSLTPNTKSTTTGTTLGMATMSSQVPKATTTRVDVPAAVPNATFTPLKATPQPLSSTPVGTSPSKWTKLAPPISTSTASSTFTSTLTPTTLNSPAVKSAAPTGAPTLPPAGDAFSPSTNSTYQLPIHLSNLVKSLANSASRIQATRPRSYSSQGQAATTMTGAIGDPGRLGGASGTTSSSGSPKFNPPTPTAMQFTEEPATRPEADLSSPPAMA